jgi:O-antigen/teichoic acid export membrane protein
MTSAVINQILVSGATFLIGIAAARLLGLEQFGRYSIVFIIATILQGFQNSFLLIPMMTLAGLRARRTRFYYRGLMASNVMLSSAAGVAAALIVGIGFGWRDGAVPWGLAASGGLYTAAQSFLFTVRRMLFARREPWQAMVLDLLRYVLLAASILLVWSRLGAVSVEALLTALALSALVASIPYMLRIGAGGVNRRLLRAIWRRHWPFARWLLPMSIVTFAQDQAVTLSLGFFLSDEAVGGLRAGQYLLGATHFIMMAMENFVPGGAARALSVGGHAELRRFLMSRLVIFGIPTGLLIVLLAWNAGAALRFVFGDGYERFAPLLNIFAVSYACVFVRDMWSQYFRAIERTDVIFRSFVVSCVIVAVLLVPALKVYGVTGAALLILATNLTSMIYVVTAAWLDLRGAVRQGTPNE